MNFVKYCYLIVACAVGFLAYQQGGWDALAAVIRKDAMEDARDMHSSAEGTKRLVQSVTTPEGLAGELRSRASEVVKKQTGTEEGDFVKLMEKYAREDR